MYRNLIQSCIEMDSDFITLSSAGFDLTGMSDNEVFER